MKKRNEGQEQEVIFQWAAYQSKYQDLARCMFAIPNGGSRHKLEAYSLKRQGVKAGVSDITIQIARGGYHGMWLELKVKPNKASDKQLAFLAEMKKQGYYTVVAFGATEAIAEIEHYMSLKRKEL